MTNLEKPFLTSDLYLAAFLCMKGLTLLSVTPDTPRKFVLVDRDDRDDLVEQWITETGDGYVAKNYAKKLRMAKTALYGDKN